MVWALDYCYAEFYLEDVDGKGAQPSVEFRRRMAD
jgi:hypothetical protein